MTVFMRNIVGFFCGVCLALGLHAHEVSYRIYKSFLIDAPDGMTVDQLPQRAFVPYQYDLHLGFQSKPVWLRFQVEPIVTQTEPKDAQHVDDSQMILRLAPFQLDIVEVYEKQGSGWRMMSVGDRVVMNDRICPDDTHCVALLNAPDESQTLYLKVHQRGILSVRAEVLPFKQLSQAVAAGVGRNSAAIAIAGSLLFMALVLLVVERNMLLFTFCCFQALVVVFILCTSGRLHSWMPNIDPAVFDVLSHHLFSLRVTMFVLLGWASLSVYKPTVRYRQMVFALLVLLLLSNLLIRLDEIQAAIFVYLFVSAANLYVQTYGIKTAAIMPKSIRALLLFAYVVYFVVLAGALLVIFGQLMPLATSNFINSYADWRTNGGPAGVIIFLIVIIQQAERKMATTQMIGKLSLEAAQSLAHQEKLTERQTLIDMLTHELKNPLGTIRFALASLKKQSQEDHDAMARVLRMDRSVERMNELIEHVAHSNKIDRFQLTDEKEVIDAQELIDDLTSDLHPDRRFVFSIEPGSCFFTHRHMLSVVLENFISNAYKYDDRTRPISILVARQQAWMVVQITNSIDPRIRPDESKLFDRYYRHDGVQSLPGMGIGLSLASSAAEKIQAKVSCQIQDHLVTFKVEVPHEHPPHAQKT